MDTSVRANRQRTRQAIYAAVVRAYPSATSAEALYAAAYDVLSAHETTLASKRAIIYQWVASINEKLEHTHIRRLPGWRYVLVYAPEPTPTPAPRQHVENIPGPMYPVIPAGNWVRADVPVIIPAEVLFPALDYCYAARDASRHEG